MKKRAVISMLMILMMVLSMFTPVSADLQGSSAITISNIKDVAGSTVNVEVKIENNPGILGATLTLEFDEGLTLTKATKGSAFESIEMTPPGMFTSPCNFLFSANELAEDDIADGVILTLEFVIPEEAAAGTKYDVKMSYDSDGGIIDSNLESVTPSIVNGSIEVLEFIYGDLNSDKKVNTADAILISRQVAGGYSQTINEEAADVNGDSKINTADVILVKRYIAGGYGITLPYIPDTPDTPESCDHTIVYIPAKSPTEIEEGNIEYWHCSNCGKYFSDENGNTEINISETVIPPLSSDILSINMADVKEYRVPVAGTSGTKGSVEYSVSDTNSIHVTIDKDATVYYNGVEISNVTSWKPDTDAKAQYLLQKSGNITLALVGRSTTADFDTVYITAYDVLVVDSVESQANTLIAKTTSDAQLIRIVYNEDDGDVKAALLNTEGAEMNWADLVENDVLLVKYVKSDKAVYEAQLCGEKVTGIISEVDASANWGTMNQTYADYKYVTINGTEYKVLACAESDKKIKVGDEGTYYLSESSIVWHEASIAVNENYGYVIKAAKATDMDDAQIKLITKENGIVTFDVAAKIYVTDMDINGAGKGYERSTAKISSKNLEGYVATGDLITYKVDASNTVTAIELPLDMSNNQNSIYDAEDYFTYHDSKDLTNFDPDDSTFGNLTLTEDTVVFDVTDGDKDNWGVVAIKILAEGDALGGAKIYNVDDNDNIGAIVVTDISKTVILGTSDTASFITGSSQAYDEDGVLVDYVKALVNGENVTYVLDGGAVPAVGSLVIPRYKINGDVKSFTAITNGFVQGLPSASNYCEGIAGAPSAQDSSKGRITVGGTTYKIPETANVYVYDNRSSNTNRVKYSVEYFGYIEYDNPSNGGIYGWYIDEDDKNLNITVTMYRYDGDIVDLVYTIND